MKQQLYLGTKPLQSNRDPVRGQQMALEGEDFYQIANYERMRPFFMSLVSDGNLWMFISSTGALTAGRRNPDLALFPYYTDDKIHDSAEVTGSKTILIVRRQDRNYLWEPFSERCRGVWRVRRNLYKNLWGNKLVFEERNEDLGLTFRYGWCNSDRFGFVRRAWLNNFGKAHAQVRLLDGLQNLMPCGAGSQFQLEYSTLLDAYKKNELVAETGLGLFRLSAIPVDRPEPAEALRTTVAWSLGPHPSLKVLSSTQLNAFREGLPLRQETDVRAERGAYFLQTELALPAGQTEEWAIVADVGRGPSEVAELNRLLRRPARLQTLVKADIARGTEGLRRIVGKADGIEKTAQPLSNTRHFSNVLCNVMRGGVFYDGCQIDSADLHSFIQHANREVAARHVAFFRKLHALSAPASRDPHHATRIRHHVSDLSRPLLHSQLVALARESSDPHLERLCREYLPLTFSRRHGDPSRPWNRFSIATKNPDGTRILNYEGNWRDIFQNWEALSRSFPDYTAGMVCKFVNASTADGYNPYRITRDGIDWEVLDPADPWSHIGYWGDHQVIYLLKLLEGLQRHEPGTLRDFLTREIFSYANVPYRIKPYDQVLADPKDTVVFDWPLEKLVRERVKTTGSDGRLVWDRRGEVRLVNLSEKLLVSLLAKLSNFVPDAGIWLNTQRPEWNDANNALVGNGASMVTLYYLRRFLAFCLDVFRPLEQSDVVLSVEVGRLFEAVRDILERQRPLLEGRIADDERKQVLDDLGRAGSRYRAEIYTRGFSGRKARIKGSRILEFFETALAFADASIDTNRRPDGLYHAYNLITLEKKGAISIRRLYEMLEGQVAVLSSGRLSAQESLDVLLALRHSAMFRADQHSYLLYPNRQLPRFLEKNNIPAKVIARSRLLRKLLATGDRQLVERDVNGQFHFTGAITNARDLGRILEELAAAGYGPLVKSDKALILESFERLFDHQSFSGRSGTFFGYEGLGCIYWHMVSKLLLAAQESFFRAADAGAPPAVLKRLAECYYDIRSGLGDQKPPEVYGAFPMDPYSHTPGHAGARQPGLTGQVKEDILCRAGELGVFVEEGQIRFRPLLLRRQEFLAAPARFSYFDISGAERRLRLEPGSLAFTFCQAPVVYQLAKESGVAVFRANGAVARQAGLRLDAATSRLIFERTGEVKTVWVSLRA